MLIITSLAVWRATALLVYDDGPWKLFVRLRDALGGPFRCFWCLSGWVSLVASCLIATNWRELVIEWFAVWAVAVLIDEVRWNYLEECDAEEAIEEASAEGDEGYQAAA